MLTKRLSGPITAASGGEIISSRVHLRFGRGVVFVINPT